MQPIDGILDKLLIQGDKVWFVLDTDIDKFKSREPQIKELRKSCLELKWGVAQSNPCFEVWLYYHFFSEKPEFEGYSFCKGWKPLLDNKGGFDSRKHPILIQTATDNAENNYAEEDGSPDVGSTEVFRLSTSILSIVKEKVAGVLAGITRV